MEQDTQRLKLIATEFQRYTCNTEEDLGLKGFTLGALYGLIKAEKLGYAHRTGPSLSTGYEAELNDISKIFSEGNVVDNGQWVSGFYFNSALQRIAGGYHRGLKLLTGDNLEVQELASIAIKRKLTEKSEINWIDTVYGEVNKLHRDRYGLLKGRAVTLSDAISATEQLLALAIKVRLGHRPI